ncbi:heme-binding protein [Massilia sp. X63]|uniref:SOUL family heme-binding protein n=1 Tax=Massilia sp. X63 TaxID=3237285 RepID=UPI0034DCEA1B
MKPASQVRRRSLPRQAPWLIGSLVLLALAVLPATSHAVEEPAYTTVQTFPAFEIRQYAGYAVAEVVVPGPASDAGNQAFPILAGYIFGKNKGERRFAMTAPVTQAAAPVRLEMTAPVTQRASPEGFLVQFVLPAGVSMANAPEPLDSRVVLRDVPARRVAVLRYSGFWSASNYDKHLAKLQDALRAAGIAWKGEPVLSRYNAPMTPWFMRRNEIWLYLD